MIVRVMLVGVSSCDLWVVETAALERLCGFFLRAGDMARYDAYAMVLDDVRGLGAPQDGGDTNGCD